LACRMVALGRRVVAAASFCGIQLQAHAHTLSSFMAHVLATWPNATAEGSHPTGLPFYGVARYKSVGVDSWLQPRLELALSASFTKA
jgi:hypothetical protein